MDNQPIKNMTTYNDYLLSKQISAKPRGFHVDKSQINPWFHEWQKDIIIFNCLLGSAGDFLDMGLGKTGIQIETARLVHEHSKAPVLIVCPLAVASQTIREGAKISVDIERIHSVDDAKMSKSPITIVNFDMWRKMTPEFWKDGMVIIDESSILASHTGATKKHGVKFMNQCRYGGLYSGTPARNSYIEFGGSVQALGIMKSSEMLANWFSTGTGKVKTGEIVAGKYTLKPYGEEDFWRWLTTWSTIVKTPSDIGGDDDGYILPGIKINNYQLPVDHRRAWDNIEKTGQRQLLLNDNPSSTEMWAEKRHTYKDRVKKTLELSEERPNDYHILWGDMNNETTLLHKEMVALYGSDAVVEVSGKDNTANKEAKLDAFSRGDVLKIITKSKIAGMGLNWQHCHWQSFVSINYSFEQYAQRIARTNRYGQKEVTRIDRIASETEQGILNSLTVKAKQDKKMHDMTRKIYKKYGLWRTDRKSLISDLGSTKMELPSWLELGE